MKKLLLLFLAVFTLSTFTYGQVFQENWDGIGPGITGWTLYDQDGLTVNASVSFVSAAWISTNEEFDNKVAMSTSWYTSAGTSNDWMVSPAITLPAGTNTLYWDGKAYDASYLDSYKVYVSTTGNTPSDFTTAALNVNPETATWNHHSINLSAYSGQNIYIAFQNYSNDMFLLGIDNISIINNSTCDQPSRDMFSSNTTTTSLTLNWTAIAGTTSYDVAFGTPGFTPSTATYSSSTNSKNITGLTENTRYQFYVRNSCGSAWVGPNSAFTAKNLPYNYGFDNTGGYDQDGWVGSWTTGTAAANAQAGTQYIYSANSTTAVTNRSVYTNPLYLHNGEQVTVSFYHRESSSTAARSLRLRVINEATPTVSTVIWTGTNLQSSTAYAQVTAPIYTASADGTYYFEFNDFSPVTTTGTFMRLDTVNMTSVLGTNEFLNSKFAISPNPANDFITLSNTDNIIVKSISMTDLNGRVVKQVSYSDASNIQVNVSDLASGMYLMNITSDQGTATKKVVKN
jgi:hypothetical protein